MEVTRGWGETGEYTNRREGSFVTSDCRIRIFTYFLTSRAIYDHDVKYAVPKLRHIHDFLTSRAIYDHDVKYTVLETWHIRDSLTSHAIYDQDIRMNSPNISEIEIQWAAAIILLGVDPSD